jgi:hypothetical protein
MQILCIVSKIVVVPLMKGIKKCKLKSLITARSYFQMLCLFLKTNKQNSMVWVRERTMPTERPPLVGEVIANFCG